MNFGRIFASAIARRVSYVLVAMALAWLGVGKVHAQYADCMNVNATAAACQYRSDAHAGINARLAKLVAEQVAIPGRLAKACLGAGDGTPAVGRINGQIVWRGSEGPLDCPVPASVGWGNYRSWVQECPAGETWDEETKSCGGCDSKPPLTNVTASPGSSEVCQDQCTFECSGLSVDLTVDGETRSYCGSPAWNPSGGQCSTTGPGAIGPPSPAPTDSDGDGSSDGNDSSPNNPGSGGQGPDGDGPADGDSDCGGPDQPVCGAAGSGSGNGNTSGGGGDCKTPPNSKGDQILAQIAFQTWATRCALKGNANAGSGSGDGSGDGDGDGEQPGWTKGETPTVPEDSTDYVNDQKRFGLGLSTDMLDQENIFGNSSCPAFEIKVWTATVSTNDFPGWCTLVTILRGLILIFGAFTALQILLGRGLL